MTVGIAATTLANKWLDLLSGTAFTTPPASYIGPFTADPGASGTNAPASSTSRVAMTWSAASAGSKAMSNTPTFSAWAGGSVTVTHVASFDAVTTGNFMFSAALTASKAMTNGDTLTLSTLTFALTPIAA